MSTDKLPVFPLNAALLPACRMPLQIFEKRYLDMVSRCMRSDTGFVVALLRPGAERHEVITPELEPAQHNVPFYPMGTEARIVDFGQRDNGLLAITIEGLQRVELNGIHQRADGLWLAEITPRPEQVDTTPATLEEWTDVLEQLLGFSGLEELRASVDLQSSEQVMNYLIMLMPLPASVKQELLETDQHLARWNKLNQLLTMLAAPRRADPPQ